MSFYQPSDSHDGLIPTPQSENFQEVADVHTPSADENSHYEEDAKSDVSDLDTHDVVPAVEPGVAVFKSTIQSSEAKNSIELRSMEEKDHKNMIDKIYLRCLDLLEGLDNETDYSEMKRQIEELRNVATTFCEYNSTLAEDIDTLESVRLGLENEREANLRKFEEVEAKVTSECDMWKSKYKDAMEELETAEQALYADKGRTQAAAEKQMGEDASDLGLKIKSLEESLRLLTAEKNDLQVAFNQVMAKMELANTVETEQLGEKVVPTVAPHDTATHSPLAEENEQLKTELITLEKERDALSQEVIRLTTEAVQRREQADGNLTDLSTAQGDASRTVVATEEVPLLSEEVVPVSSMETKESIKDVDLTTSKFPTEVAKGLPAGIDVGQIEMELKKVGINDTSEIHLHIHQHGHKHKHIHNHSHSHSHVYNVKQQATEV